MSCPSRSIPRKRDGTSRLVRPVRRRDQGWGIRRIALDAIDEAPCNGVSAPALGVASADFPVVGSADIGESCECLGGDGPDISIEEPCC